MWRCDVCPSYPLGELFFWGHWRTGSVTILSAYEVSCFVLNYELSTDPHTNPFREALLSPPCCRWEIGARKGWITCPRSHRNLGSQGSDPDSLKPDLSLSATMINCFILVLAALSLTLFICLFFVFNFKKQYVGLKLLKF